MFFDNQLELAMPLQTPNLMQRTAQQQAAIADMTIKAMIHNPALQALNVTSTSDWDYTSAPQKAIDTLLTKMEQSVYGTSLHSDEYPREPLGRYFGTRSYSAVGMKRTSFIKVAQDMADALPSIMHQTKADVVVVRGTSGVSVAFGIRMLADIPFMIADKRGVNSHGVQLCMVGGEQSIKRYLILDDLICSGSTVDGIQQDMGPTCECVGYVLYENFLSGTVYRSKLRTRGGLPVFGYLY